MGQYLPFGPFHHSFLVHQGNQDHQANLGFPVGQSLHLCLVYLFCLALLAHPFHLSHHLEDLEDQVFLEVQEVLYHQELPDLLSEILHQLVFSVHRSVQVDQVGPEDLVHLFHLWVPGNLSPYSPLVLVGLVDQEGPLNLVVLEDHLALIYPWDQVDLVFQEDLGILDYPLVLAVMT